MIGIHRYPLLASSLYLIITLAVSEVLSTPEEEQAARTLLRTHQSLNDGDEHDNENINTLQIEQEEDTYFKKLVKRMKPHFLQVNTDHDDSEPWLNLDSLRNSRAPYNPPVKQFYHLHHMKTGGTSLERHISCAISRYSQLFNLIQTDPKEHVYVKDANGNNNDKQNLLKIPSYKLSECSNGFYMRCISSPNSTCHNRISEASVMTYCAPLAITRHFGWNNDSFETPSVTMLRHPVDRIWSMYRFQTKTCYRCKPLKEIYADIDKGNITEYGNGVCIPQLVNHMTRNLLTNLTVDELHGYSSAMTDEEMVRDAINSIKHRFTVVGIIERLKESLQLFSYSFPWLSEEFDSEYYSQTHNYYQQYKDKLSMCKFPHDNSSPSNNMCGENHSHMDLTPHPDEETRKIIEDHNKMDIQVYEAALEHFEMQKRVMAWEEEEDIER